MSRLTTSPSSPKRGFAGLLGLLLLLWAGSSWAAPEPAPVAAAADLRFALEEIASRFSQDTGRQVRLSFGSSGNFRRQIAQGAPFELYMSADEGYVRDLEKAGLTRDGGALYAIGRIVCFAPKGSPLTPDTRLQGLTGLVSNGGLKRLAIANPEHAPYGRAAREALERAGLWQAVQGRLVLGENAAQATQFAVSGSSQGGIIPYSLALAPRIAERGRFALIPEDWHRPLRQRMVLLKGAGETARVFYDYLRTDDARRVMARFGFAVPNGGIP